MCSFIVATAFSYANYLFILWLKYSEYMWVSVGCQQFSVLRVISALVNVTSSGRRYNEICMKINFANPIIYYSLTDNGNEWGIKRTRQCISTQPKDQPIIFGFVCVLWSILSPWFAWTNSHTMAIYWWCCLAFVDNTKVAIENGYTKWLNVLCMCIKFGLSVCLSISLTPL